MKNVNIPDNTPKVMNNYVQGKNLVRDEHVSPYRTNSRRGCIFLVILFLTVLILLIISVFN